MSGAALPPLSDAQRLDWLRLIRSENVGPVTFRTLVNRYGGARAALERLPELARRGGARSIRIASAADAEREIAALATLGAYVVAMGEPGYPPLLAHAESAPPLLSVWGDLGITARRAVAIVGARNASAAGRNFTRTIASALGDAGYVVVSGLARGIDTAAHEASVESGTVAVLAGGLDRVYPPENAGLLRRIVEQGAALSEMPLRWQAQARDFPRRNRIVSGMALGVIVVEAADRSGSLITARLAGEQGREVFAVPGSPLDPRSAGTNRLIRDGATMLTAPADVIDALTVIRPEPTEALPILFRDGVAEAEPEPPADERAAILDALGPTPVQIDVLVRETGFPVGKVALVLLELELAGRLERHAGGRVSVI